MDFDAAIVVADERRDYGEVRFQAVGPILGRLHVLAFTMPRRHAAGDFLAAGKQARGRYGERRG